MGAIGVVIGPGSPLGPAVSTVFLGVFAGPVGWWIVLSAVTSTREELLASLRARGETEPGKVGAVVLERHALSACSRMHQRRDAQGPSQRPARFGTRLRNSG